MYFTKEQQIELATQFIKWQKQNKEIKAEMDDIKVNFTAVLKQEKCEKLEVSTDLGTLLVTEVPATVMQGFDLERFAAEHPELAAEYAKNTTRAGYLKMTVKK